MMPGPSTASIISELSHGNEGMPSMQALPPGTDAQGIKGMPTPSKSSSGQGYPRHWRSIDTSVAPERECSQGFPQHWMSPQPSSTTFASGERERFGSKSSRGWTPSRSPPSQRLPTDDSSHNGHGLHTTPSSFEIENAFPARATAVTHSSRSRSSRTASSKISETRLETCTSLPQTPLLRGSWLAHLLKDGGSIMKRRHATESTVDSIEVACVDSFISYNGSVPLKLQLLSLSLHFNLFLASMLTSITLFGLNALSALGMLPTYQDFNGTTGCMNTILGVPLFFFALRFGRQILHRCHLRGPSIFLDKACVCSGTREGTISGWGSFLYRSSEMLIIYSDTYLRKLWTVFEVTIFLLLHPRERLSVLPCFLPDIIVKGSIMFYVIYLLVKLISFTKTLGSNENRELLERARVVVYCALLGIAIPMFYLFAGVLRGMARERGLMHARIKQKFRVAETQCFYEADRQAVLHNIITLMKDLGYASASMADIEVLRIFDGLVRQRVAPALDIAMGPVGVPYKYVLTIIQPDLWSACDRLSGMISSQSGIQEFASYIMYATSMYFSIGPLTFYVLVLVSQVCLAQRFWIERIILMVSSMGALVFYIACQLALTHLRSQAEENKGFFMLSVAVVIILVVVVRVLYNSSWNCVYKGDNPCRSRESGGRVTVRTTYTEVPRTFQALSCEVRETKPATAA